MISLPREIVTSLEVTPRTLINLSRTCKYLHKLLTPIKFTHKYMVPDDTIRRSSGLPIDRIIFWNTNIAITYEEGKYKVYKADEVCCWFSLQGKVVEYSLSVVYNNLQDLGKANIIDRILDDKHTFSRINDTILSDSKYHVRLPDFPILYNGVSDTELDKYHKILVGDDSSLKIAYKAAMKGKQVDILKTDITDKLLKIIEANNYVNNFTNIRLIDTIEDNDYNLIFNVKVNEPLINSIYKPDICVPRITGILEMINVYKDRVISFSWGQSCLPVVKLTHYLGHSFDSLLFPADSDHVPTLEKIQQFRASFDPIISKGIVMDLCPSCLIINCDNVKILQKMHDCCIKHGHVWNQEADRLLTRIQLLKNT